MWEVGHIFTSHYFITMRWILFCVQTNKTPKTSWRGWNFFASTSWVFAYNMNAKLLPQTWQNCRLTTWRISFGTFCHWNYFKKLKYSAAVCKYPLKYITKLVRHSPILLELELNCIQGLFFVGVQLLSSCIYLF